MGCSLSTPSSNNNSNNNNSNNNNRLFRQLFGGEQGQQQRRQTATTLDDDTNYSRERQTLLKTKLVLLGDSGVGKSCIVNRFATNSFDEESRVTVGAAFQARTIEVPSSSTSTTNAETRKVKFEIWDTAGQERYESLANLYYRRAHAALVVFALDDEKSFDKARFWIEQLKEKAEKKDVLIVLCANKTDKITPEQEDRIEIGAGNSSYNNNKKKNSSSSSSKKKNNNSNAIIGEGGREQQQQQQIENEIEEGGEEEENNDEAEEDYFVSMDRAMALANELGCHMCVSCSAKTGEGIEELFSEVASRLITMEHGKSNAQQHAQKKKKSSTTTTTSTPTPTNERVDFVQRNRNDDDDDDDDVVDADDDAKKKKKKKKKHTKKTSNSNALK